MPSMVSIGTKLPTYRTSFVYRSELLATLSQELKHSRLVTLVGPPGIGKTRLAVEFASRLRPTHSMAAAFVPLSSARDMDGVRIAMGHGRGGEPQSLDISSVLADSDSLLVVLDDAGGVLQSLQSRLPDWLASGRRHRWLTTSTRPLGLPGEAVVRVDPMSIPDSDSSVSISESGALFLDRARRVAPWLEPCDEDRTLVRRLVVALDGHPLAIELAAGRLDVVSLTELVNLLEKWPSFATSATVSGGHREDTLFFAEPEIRAALVREWADAPASERALLEDLTAFYREFSLDDLLAVTRHHSAESLPESVDTLHRLVLRGMVQCTEEAGRTTYRLPGWVRSFAREVGDPAGLRAAAGRWAQHYAAQASRNSPPDSTLNMDAISESWAPLRQLASLRGIDCSSPPFEAAASAALALDEFLFTTGDVAARGRLMESVGRWMSAGAGSLADSTKARLRFMEGRWLYRIWNLEEAKKKLLQAAELGRAHNRWAEARAAACLAEILEVEDRQEEAEIWYGRARRALDVCPNTETESIVEAMLGSREIANWRLEKAEAHLRRSLDCRILCRSVYTSYAHSLLATLLRYQGKSAQAEAACDDALATSSAGERGIAQRARAELTLGVLNAEKGRYEEADTILQRSAASLQRVNLPYWYRQALVEAAASAEVVGNVVRARSLWAESANALEGARGTSVWEALAAIRLAAGLAILGDLDTAGRWSTQASKLLPESPPDDVAVTFRIHECRIRLGAALRTGNSAAMLDCFAASEAVLAEARVCPTRPPGLWHGRVRLRTEVDAAANAESNGNCPIHLLSGGAVLLPGGATLDLSRRGVAHRVVSALVSQFVESEGAPISARDLAAKVWPDDSSGESARLARLYVAIRELRTLGLSEVISSTRRGYSLRA